MTKHEELLRLELEIEKLNEAMDNIVSMLREYGTAQEARRIVSHHVENRVWQEFWGHSDDTDLMRLVAALRADLPADEEE